MKWGVNRQSLPALAVVLLLLLLASPSAAHPVLLEAIPQPGAVLAASPPSLRLVFNEPLIGNSRIVVFNQTFHEVAGVVVDSDPASPDVVTAALPELLPDTYTVQWTVASSDQHEVTGTFAFQVTGAPQPVTRFIPGGPLWPWLGVVGGLLAGLLVLILFWRRRA